MIDEVLPTIRRHGMYAIDDLLANDEFLERAIVQLRSERAKRLAAEQALLEAAPKVSYYDVVLQSDSLLSITEIAKGYGISAKKLNSLLHDAGVQFRQSGRWSSTPTTWSRATRSPRPTNTTRARPAPTCTGPKRDACSSTTYSRTSSACCRSSNKKTVVPDDHCLVKPGCGVFTPQHVDRDPNKRPELAHAFASFMAPLR